MARSIPVGRLVKFGLLQVFNAIAPLLVLPAVVRVVGQDGWIGLAIGLSSGAAAAVAINYAWPITGPPLVAGEPIGQARKVLLLSLKMRVLVAIPVLMVAALGTALLAPSGHRTLAISMACATAVAGFSSNWYFTGRARPDGILLYETLPRLVATGLSIPAVAMTRQPLLYPALLGGFTILGTLLGCYAVLGRSRTPVPWLSVLRATREQLPIASAGVVSAAATALSVNVAALAGPPAAVIANFASAIRLRSMAQAAIGAATAALQGWVSEYKALWTRRAVTAFRINSVVGLVAAAATVVAAPPVSRLVFGDSATISTPLAIVLAGTCLLYSMSASLTNHTLAPAGMQRSIVRTTMAGALVGVPTILGLTHYFGEVGAMTGCLAAEAVVLALQLRLRSVALRPGRHRAATA